MYGSQYYRGLGTNRQSGLSSPQSGPADTVERQSRSQYQASQQQAGLGAGPAVAKAARFNPSFSSPQTYNPNAIGTSIYDQYEQSPDWLQQYVEHRLKGEGQSGYYDPALQARDIYQSLSPEINQLYSNYGQKNFLNPYFAKQDSVYNTKKSWLDSGLNPFLFGNAPTSRSQATNEYGAVGYSGSKQHNGDLYSSAGYYDPFKGKVQTQKPVHRRLW